MIRKFSFLITLVFLCICTSCEKQNTTESCVVINEIMAVNNITQADQNGEYDDWIELGNSCELRLNLSGYYLSDSKSKLNKWRFPEGTTIEGRGYLTIWADGDTLQSGLHTSFKLSSDGENLYFSTPDLLIIDKVEYPAQYQEISFARNPNLTGDFRWQTPTFSAPNN